MIFPGIINNQSGHTPLTPQNSTTTLDHKQVHNNSTVPLLFSQKRPLKIHFTHTHAKFTVKPLPLAGNYEDDHRETPNRPVPTQWYNRQGTNDDIRYFRTPINNDFKLQEITNEIIRLKVVQFNTSQRIQYLDWCNRNGICPNDFTISVKAPELDDLGFKHQKHCMEVMETSIKRYTETHIAHYQEQHNYAQFQLQQKNTLLQRTTPQATIDFIEDFSNKEANRIIKRQYDNDTQK